MSDFKRQKHRAIKCVIDAPYCFTNAYNVPLKRVSSCKPATAHLSPSVETNKKTIVPFLLILRPQSSLSNKDLCPRCSRSFENEHHRCTDTWSHTYMSYLKVEFKYVDFFVSSSQCASRSFLSYLVWPPCWLLPSTSKSKTIFIEKQSKSR